MFITMQEFCIVFGLPLFISDQKYSFLLGGRFQSSLVLKVRKEPWEGYERP